MEEAITIRVGNRFIYGILHSPDVPKPLKIVVVMVNGGPQTRVGSHRLYTHLARYLCDQHLFVLRFDYEGLGDSDGQFLGFRHAGPSIEAALDFIDSRFKKKIKKILWSLCDGASASIMFGAQYSSKVAGIIICNPYISDEVHSARTRLKYYYLKKSLSLDFWRRLMLFRINFLKSFKDILFFFLLSYGRFWESNTTRWALNSNLGDEVLESMKRFNGKVGIVLSTGDLVAMEFNELLLRWKKSGDNSNWDRISLEYIKNADHTFTVPAEKKKMFALTLQMIKTWNSSTFL